MATIFDQPVTRHILGELHPPANVTSPNLIADSNTQKHPETPDAGSIKGASQMAPPRKRRPERNHAACDPEGAVATDQATLHR